MVGLSWPSASTAGKFSSSGREQQTYDPNYAPGDPAKVFGNRLLVAKIFSQDFQAESICQDLHEVSSILRRWAMSQTVLGNYIFSDRTAGRRRSF